MISCKTVTVVTFLVFTSINNVVFKKVSSNETKSTDLNSTHFGSDFEGFANGNKPKSISIRSVDECGVRYREPNKNITVHGDKVNPLDWPWLAVLYKITHEGIEYKCVGSLVSRNKIVTAAHCVVTSLPSQFIVFLSRFNTKQWGANDDSVAKEVLDIVIHPSYLDHKTKGADLAVLTLKYKTSYNYKIRPVCIFIHHEYQPYEIQGSVIGWGRNERDNYVTPEARRVDLKIVNSKECIDYNEQFNSVVADFKFCAANDTEGIGPCQGDSGGGFYVRRKISGGQEIWSLRGVVSGSLKLEDKDDCLDQKYFTFTDMEKQIAWLRDQIEVNKEVSTDRDVISEQQRQNKTQKCAADLAESKENFVKEKIRLASKLYQFEHLIPTLITSKITQVQKFKESKDTTALGYILKIITHLKEKNKGINISQESINKIVNKNPNLKVLNDIIHAEQENIKSALLNKVVSNIEIAKYLISSGADPYYVSKEGESPILSAVLNGNLKLIKYYKDTYNVNINIKNKEGFSALHYATLKGNLNIVKYLVESKINCNIQDNKGFTPMHIAAINGYYQIIKYLVENCNANTNLRNKEGQTPLDLAISKSYFNIIEYLSLKTKGEYHMFDNSLHKAAFYGNLELIKNLISKNIDINMRDSKKQTALIWSSKSGHLDVFKYLAEMGKADINLRDENGLTVTHWAALSGHLNVIKYLVNKFNIDLMDRDKNGSTALHWAAQMGYLDVIIYLIKEGKMDFDIENYKAETPLDLAKRNYRGKVIDWLQKYEHDFYSRGF